MVDLQTKLIELPGVYAVEIEGSIRYKDGTDIKDIQEHKKMILETSPLRKKTVKQFKKLMGQQGTKF